MVPVFLFLTTLSYPGGLPSGPPPTPFQRNVIRAVLGLFFVLAFILIHQSLYIRYIPSYRMKVTVQEYTESRFFFSRFTSVSAKMSSGEMIKIDTTIRPENCNRKHKGATFEVLVMPQGHVLFDLVKYRYLKTNNACY